jgi:hypothetical protein
MLRIQPYFPLTHGIAMVDDRRVISGIVHGTCCAGAMHRATTVWRCTQPFSTSMVLVGTVCMKNASLPPT